MADKYRKLCEITHFLYIFTQIEALHNTEYAGCYSAVISYKQTKREQWTTVGGTYASDGIAVTTFAEKSYLYLAALFTLSNIISRTY